MPNGPSVGALSIALILGGCTSFAGKSLDPFEAGVPGYSAESIAAGEFRIAYFSRRVSSDKSAQSQFEAFAKSLCPLGYNSEAINEVMTIGTSHDVPSVGLGFRGVLLCNRGS